MEQLINMVGKLLTVLYLRGYIDNDEKEFILGTIDADKLLELKKAEKSEKKEDNNTCKGCIHNMGSLSDGDIYCEYIEDYINNTRCEYYEGGEDYV